MERELEAEISYPFHRQSVRYGNDHKLQTLDICLPRPLKESAQRHAIWIVFIHGGAWRDPLQDSSEVQPALKQFLEPANSKTAVHHIAGFASVNYGLSQGNANDSSLDVTHPQHIQDVIKALEWLRREYNVGDTSSEANNAGSRDWIAVGHSCGASLAFQLCMGYSQPWSSQVAGACMGQPPIAVVGLEGIYDLPLLVKNHSDIPFYADFVKAAFGNDKKVWQEASPTSGKYHNAYDKGGLRVVVLCQSTEDELVEWEQVDVMQQCLEKQIWRAEDGDNGNKGGGVQNRRELVILKLIGLHDEVWSKGDGVRIGIETAIEQVIAKGLNS